MIVMGTNWMWFFELGRLWYLDLFDSGDQLKMIGTFAPMYLFPIEPTVMPIVKRCKDARSMFSRNK